MHPLIENSFVFLHTAGSRPSPEVLVLELFREVFYKTHHVSTRARPLDPEETDEKEKHVYDERERAVIYALRGRRKKAYGQKINTFFAPAYHTLVENCGLREKSERVVKNYLFAGPIAQYLLSKGNNNECKIKERNLFVELVVNALIGSRTCLDVEGKGKEILSVALKDADFNMNRELGVENIEKKIGEYSHLVMKGLENDELSNKIYTDFSNICIMEKKIPRLQWIQILMTYLRFALPLWMLSHMQITSCLHEWLIDAVENRKIARYEDIIKRIRSRNRRLLIPTLTPSRQVIEHIETYMKYRVEINILLNKLQNIGADINDKRLILDGKGSDIITVEELLVLASKQSELLKKEVFKGIETWRFLAREGEKYPAWRNPLKRCQGENIDEFMRVMYQDKLGDEGWRLFAHSKRKKY